MTGVPPQAAAHHSAAVGGIRPEGGELPVSRRLEDEGDDEERDPAHCMAAIDASRLKQASSAGTERTAARNACAW